MDSKSGIGLQGVDSDDKNSSIIQKRLNKVIDTNIDNDKVDITEMTEIHLFFFHLGHVQQPVVNLWY